MMNELSCAYFQTSESSAAFNPITNVKDGSTELGKTTLIRIDGDVFAVVHIGEIKLKDPQRHESFATSV